MMRAISSWWLQISRPFLETYRVGVPEPGFYREIMNTDAENIRGRTWETWAKPRRRPFLWNNHLYSIHVRMPALAVIYCTRERR